METSMIYMGLVLTLIALVVIALLSLWLIRRGLNYFRKHDWGSGILSFVVIILAWVVTLYWLLGVRVR